MSFNKVLREEIINWVRTQGRHYHNTDFDAFWANLESEDIELPSGTAEYVDIESVGVDEQLAVFSVGAVYYAFGGSSSSWHSEWDSGPYEVEKRTVTLERWETI